MRLTNNGQVITLNLHTIKKGCKTKQGRQVWMPDIDNLTYEDLCKFHGASAVDALFRRAYKHEIVSINNMCKGDTTKFEAAFKELTLSKRQQKQALLQTLVEKYKDNPDIQALVQLLGKGKAKV